MIPVPNPIPEPKDFDAKCRKKGSKWLVDHPGSRRPKDYWSPFRGDLSTGFGDRCGFGAMWIPSGTVDHFISCNEDESQAYEWTNYRFVDGWMNSAKSKKKSKDILDPFLVEDGWFEILLPSMQLALSPFIPDAIRALAEATIHALPLRDDERVIRVRREWYRMYEDGDLTLSGLRAKAPLIAAAVEKRDRSRPPV